MNKIIFPEQLPEVWNSFCRFDSSSLLCYEILNMGLLIALARDRSARLWSIPKGARRIHRHYRRTSLRSASPIFLLVASVCSLRPPVSPLTDPWVGVFRGRSCQGTSALIVKAARKRVQYSFPDPSRQPTRPAFLSRHPLQLAASSGVVRLSELHININGIEFMKCIV